MKIELQNISKAYMEGGKTHTILSGLNAQFSTGKFSVILGKSGSGKSTLLNIMGGIDVPDKGKVLIENTDLADLSDYDRTLFRRRKLGFVFQFFNLIPTLTVLENTMLIRELDGVRDHTNRKMACAMLEEVGLGNRIDAMPDILSGGEQQRVAIARAFAHDPQFILADEPTGNLDHETGMNVLQMMVRLVQEKRKTLIMATHSEDALAAADYVFRIENRMLVPALPAV
ncbi:ABC transporter ATP-binding protein [bacterium]|nr:ABC transporter ATP-binding protein [bacterium]